MAKIMVVAGEVSGDMQAARVINALKEKRDNLEFIGMGGEEMQKAGVKILYDPTQISTIGFIEALKHLRTFNQLLAMLSSALDQEKCDLLFLVDYSGFNMKMSRIGQKKDVPVVDYFSPSAWVWGKWRAKKMAKWDAKIAAVFPMEAEVYQNAGAEVTFVGHPLLDFVIPEKTPAEFKKSLGLKENNPIIGILFGSRKGEINSLARPMLEAARLVSKERPDLTFVSPIASLTLKEMLTQLISDEYQDLPLYLIDGQSYEVMNSSEAILCASGTATLEAACLKVPMVIAYITSWSTYNLGKLLANVKCVGLPNIIAGTTIVPEFLQNDVTGPNLADALLKILNEQSYRADMIKNLADVRTALGESGAVNRVADLILRVLDDKGNTAQK